ncbi:Multiple ankyrin repeats single kh domain [Mycena kentingensis (nom. inval.)]|nr:Multiple ankyrin repeats single kh domain [Mycena kentingensis (nom. inval.)]
MSCSIPPNPDISGVGVRSAIYTQNILCFFPVVLHLWDGTITELELDGVKDQSIGMLAIAFAILISTIVQARSGGSSPRITNYHAAIILGLSWINNTSTWIWFILFVHHQSKLAEPTPAAFRAWLGRLAAPLPEVFATFDPGWDRVNAENGESIPLTTLPRASKRIRLSLQRIWHFAARQSVLTLGSLHLSVMDAIGIWLWLNRSDFGCDPQLAVIGQGVSFSSKSLRIGSLIIYFVVLVPGLNLFPPFLFFLAIHIGYNALRARLARDRPGPGLSPSIRGDMDVEAKGEMATRPDSSADSESDQDPGSAREAARTKSPDVRALIAAPIFLVLFNAMFVIDIERTIRLNKGEQSGSSLSPKILPPRTA